MSYRIFETSVYQKDLNRLPPAVKPKIESKLSSYVYPQLRLRPQFGPNIRKLKNWKPETWRYRIGQWRFFYEVSEAQRVVFMTTLEHRKDAY